MTTCSNCKYCAFAKGNGSPSRYYCRHPKGMEGVGTRIVCRCKRGSDELTIKTQPKWCPIYR